MRDTSEMPEMPETPETPEIGVVVVKYLSGGYLPGVCLPLLGQITTEGNKTQTNQIQEL